MPRNHSPGFIRDHYDTKAYRTSAIGTAVVRSSAIDRDHGSNGDLVYSILSGNELDSFQIDPSLGIVTIGKSLRTVESSEINLLIRVEDKGVPPLSDDAKIRILLEAEPLGPKPRFDKPLYEILMREDVNVGTYLTSIHADSAEAITYSFSNDAASAHFSLHPLSGAILLRNRLSLDSIQQVALRGFLFVNHIYVFKGEFFRDCKDRSRRTRRSCNTDSYNRRQLASAKTCKIIVSRKSF